MNRQFRDLDGARTRTSVGFLGSLGRFVIMGASVYNDKIARILILNSSPVLSTFDMCPCMATGYGSVTSLGNRNF